MMALSPDRWRQAEAIFGEAVDLPTTARSAFVARVCGSDAALTDAVRSLLRTDAEAAPLDRPALSLGPSASSAARTQRLPTVRGYKLVRPIGEGGMGTVYRAEREEGDRVRPIALKLLGTFRDSTAARRRHAREGEILSRLDHPNIARFLNAGTTEDGRPYVAMAYVDGAPIDAFCDTQRRSIDDRVALFEKVCRAVRYAHQKLVVHRDLKPSNILVTDEGEPHLLDFGIATLLAAQEDDVVERTRTLDRCLTPHYASPEQLAGEAVATATDVYSLGVLLYVLLTGALPHEADAQPTLADLARAKREEPVAPSRVARLSTVVGGVPSAHERAEARGSRPAPLERHLRGDLDAIVLRCLRGEPEQRYASVEELLDDLRRHRRGEPVAARRGGVAYRVGKLVRRNVAAFAAATVFIGGLATVAVMSRTQAARLAVERDAARVAQAEAEDVTSFLTEIFLASDPLQRPGSTSEPGELTVREVLDRSAERLRTERRDQPRLQAKLMNTMAIVYTDLGELDRAQALNEEALAIRRAVMGDDASETIESLNGVALGHINAGRGSEVKALLAPALEAARRLTGEDAYQLAVTLKHLAAAHEFEGDFATAESMARESLELFEGLEGASSQDAVRLRRQMAGLFKNQGDPVAAAEILHEAIDLRADEVGFEHPDVALLEISLAEALQAQGRMDEAEARLRHALTVNQTSGGLGMWELNALNALAAIARERGELDGAVAHLETAMAATTRLLGPDHVFRASLETQLGLVHLERQDPQAGETALRVALAVIERTFGPDHFQLASYEHNLGLALADQARWAEAEQHVRRGHDLAQKHLGPDHASTGVIATSLAGMLVDRSRFDEARVMIDEALRVLRLTFDAEHQRIARAEHVRGACLAATGAVEEGVALMKASQTRIAAALGAASRASRVASRRFAKHVG